VMPKRRLRLALILEFEVACGCRALNPAILVMQSASDWATKSAPVAIDGARDRRIFLQGYMRAGPIVILASIGRTKLERVMTPTQIAKAQKLARGWKSR
jgi:hypothetical protein